MVVVAEEKVCKISRNAIHDDFFFFLFSVRFLVFIFWESNRLNCAPGSLWLWEGDRKKKNTVTAGLIIAFQLRLGEIKCHAPTDTNPTDSMEQFPSLSLVGVTCLPTPPGYCSSPRWLLVRKAREREHRWMDTSFIYHSMFSFHFAYNNQAQTPN